jgi:hypothetical protein
VKETTNLSVGIIIMKLLAKLQVVSGNLAGAIKKAAGIIMRQLVRI